MVIFDYIACSRPAWDTLKAALKEAGGGGRVKTLGDMFYFLPSHTGTWDLGLRASVSPSHHQAKIPH